ncbi:hypothetical protein [Modestobacter versicolor]|uniref:hypothetical protein n=1 Tax=Modestobacter versicolor TaxID=429133 RepID=UPI0034DFFF25
MISPFRGDVVLAGFVLAIPVLLLGMRGDFSVDDVVTRLLWCLGAGWLAVTVVRLASTPPAPRTAPTAADPASGADPDSEPAPA